MTELYIGLMSGTSMDAIDAVIVDFQDGQVRLLEQLNWPLPEDISRQIISLGTNTSLTGLGRLDVRLGRLFAEAAQSLLKKAGLDATQIIAIGSHGQTIYHDADSSEPFSTQIGDPNIIAEQTGITTIADFRRRDIAAGGNGAPLVPAFHKEVFQSEGKQTAVINIGGIANVTILPATLNEPVTGYDTGPGNTLMDCWVLRHLGKRMDSNGQWAASGQILDGLLEGLLKDPYFDRPAPKSTGREYFNLAWLEQTIPELDQFRANDVQATLCELTAVSISQSLSQQERALDRVLVCGGGAHNAHLMDRLKANSTNLDDFKITSTAAFNIEPDWVEAIAFAWLAKQTRLNKAGNLPSVTGARHPVVLGGIYQGDSVSYRKKQGQRPERTN